MSFILHARGPQIDSLLGHKDFFNFFQFFGGKGVRILKKIGTFSTAVNSHKTSFAVYVSVSYISPIKVKYRRVPEIDQKIIFIKFY